MLLVTFPHYSKDDFTQTICEPCADTMDSMLSYASHCVTLSGNGQCNNCGRVEVSLRKGTDQYAPSTQTGDVAPISTGCSTSLAKLRSNSLDALSSVLYWARRDREEAAECEALNAEWFAFLAS